VTSFQNRRLSGLFEASVAELPEPDCERRSRAFERRSALAFRLALLEVVSGCEGDGGGGPGAAGWEIGFAELKAVD
jgi:hypothetical protein